MITLRPSQERGQSNLGWLRSRFTFSFAEYYDPQHVHFRHLRVINEDHIAQGTGFGTHPHRDMEIITYLLAGALKHRDSMGEQSVIRPGDVQGVSAGTGITHSEMNPSPTEQTHLLQIWILPDAKGHTPSYEEKHFTAEEKSDRWCLVAGKGGPSGAISINQDARLYATLLGAGKELSYDLAPGRYAWLQVARGSASLNGVELAQGDGVAVSEEKTLVLRAHEPAEVLLFDLA